jgi:hypothetical protein
MCDKQKQRSNLMLPDYTEPLVVIVAILAYAAWHGWMLHRSVRAQERLASAQEKIAGSR